MDIGCEGKNILKTYSNHVWKTTQKQVWVAASTLNDMCLIHVSAKSTQKSNKKSKPFIASLQLWNSSKCELQMKICLKQKM